MDHVDSDEWFVMFFNFKSSMNAFQSHRPVGVFRLRGRQLSLEHVSRRGPLTLMHTHM